MRIERHELYLFYFIFYFIFKIKGLVVVIAPYLVKSGPCDYTQIGRLRDVNNPSHPFRLKSLPSLWTPPFDRPFSPVNFYWLSRISLSFFSVDYFFVFTTFIRNPLKLKKIVVRSGLRYFIFLEMSLSFPAPMRPVWNHLIKKNHHVYTKIWEEKNTVKTFQSAPLSPVNCRATRFWTWLRPRCACSHFPVQPKHIKQFLPV